MNDFLMWAGGVIITGLFSLIGWVIGMIFSKFKDHEQVHLDLFKADKELDKKVDEHRLYAAETFTTKLDIKDMKDELMSTLVRMEGKIDQKQDKR